MVIFCSIHRWLVCCVVLHLMLVYDWHVVIRIRVLEWLLESVIVAAECHQQAMLRCLPMLQLIPRNLAMTLFCACFYQIYQHIYLGCSSRPQPPPCPRAVPNGRSGGQQQSPLRPQMSPAGSTSLTINDPYEDPTQVQEAAEPELAYNPHTYHETPVTLMKHNRKPTLTLTHSPTSAPTQL